MYKMLLSLFCVFFFGCSSIGPKMMVEKESPLSFDETVKKIETNISQKKWEVSKKFDFQKTLLDKKNVDVGPVVSLKICHPDHALEILKDDSQKFISAMMPCSISIYTKKDKTFISYMNIGLMKKFFNSKIEHVMGKVQDDIDEIVSFK